MGNFARGFQVRVERRRTSVSGWCVATGWFLLIALINSIGRQHDGSWASSLALCEAAERYPAPITDDYMPASTTPAELLRARGFVAREYYFITQDGYILNIVRGTNPLVNKGKRGLSSKQPILFVHGATVSSTSFLVNSARVRPRNLVRRLGRASTLRQLIKRLVKETSAKSLPFLAMNLGYEVWLLDRRGCMKSRNKVGHLKRTFLDALKAIPFTLFGNLLSGFSFIGSLIPGRPNKRPPPARSASTARAAATGAMDDLVQAMLYGKVKESALEADRLMEIIGPLINIPHSLTSKPLLLEEAIKTFDPDFWSYSLDEQAVYDLPAAVDFVLAKTKKKRVHLVTLSCSGAIALMSLAEKPELADKIGRAVHWAPSVTLGSESDNVYLMGFMVPFMQTYLGPVPPTFVERPLEMLLQLFCRTNHKGRKNLCERLLDISFGFSGRQAPLTTNFWASAVQSVGVNEMIHLGQLGRTKQPCKFNFNTPQKNIERYGTREVPCYDLSKIRLKHMSFYVGKYDRLVSWADLNTTISRLTVPTKMTLIRERGIYFNHLGFLVHSQTARLAIIPSLFDIEQTDRLLRGATSHSATSHNGRSNGYERQPNTTKGQKGY